MPQSQLSEEHLRDMKEVKWIDKLKTLSGLDLVRPSMKKIKWRCWIWVLQWVSAPIFHL